MTPARIRAAAAAVRAGKLRMSWTDPGLQLWTTPSADRALADLLDALADAFDEANDGGLKVLEILTMPTCAMTAALVDAIESGDR